MSSLYYKKDARLYILFVAFFLFSAILLARLFIIQVLDKDVYTALSEKIHQRELALVPVRGEIYVYENEVPYPIVVNKDYYLVFADPRKIIDEGSLVEEIAPILGIADSEKSDLIKKLEKKDDPYEPVKKKVDSDTVETLKKLNYPGIYFIRESFRMYSEKGIGGHVLGFVDSEGAGKYGIEGFFNKELYGKSGYTRAIKDVFGSPIATEDFDIQRSVDGLDVILTIDKAIQYTSCESVKKGVEEFQAFAGSIIVMEPMTGRIIAMCSFPDFDPENFNKVQDLNIFNNPAIFYAYEPGSIFKTITFAIGIDLNKITPKTKYEDTGEIKIVGQKSIKNSDLKAYGIQTMTEALEKSLNTGAIYVVEKIGNDDFRKYVEDFGFGRITGIELSSEVAGNISSLSKRGQIYSMTASFGQGITVTSIQFITAFSSLVNGGKLMKPYIVEKFLQEGKPINETKPEVVRQVISPQASSIITNMMVSVVENGYSKKANIPGYYVGGKTGTAQVAGKDGKYGDESIHTFIGFTPAYDPRFVILIKMDNPKKFKFSSETATLVFKDLAEYILRVYNIPPERAVEKNS